MKQRTGLALRSMAAETLRRTCGAHRMDVLEAVAIPIFMSRFSADRRP